MKTLDLEDRYKDFIKTTIENILGNVEIYIYGSRVQGKAQKYSDVDIALKWAYVIPIEKIIRLKAVFHDSTFPYKVDIVDIKTLSDKFLKIIEKDLYKIN